MEEGQKKIEADKKAHPKFEDVRGEFKRLLITNALIKTSGNIAGAARLLGTTYRVVKYNMRKLGIEYDEHLIDLVEGIEKKYKEKYRRLKRAVK